MDAIFALANNLAATQYADLAHEVVEATKQEILDTLAVMLAGSNAPGGQEIAGVAREFGGAGKSTIVVYGGKVSPPFAALANSTMGHALDYDDTYDPSPSHPGVTAIPAAFAAAEHVGKVSGKDFITAVALGVDVACRLALASPKEVGGKSSGVPQWHKTSIYGFFGAAAAAAKLLRLDEDKVVNALGIAYSQVAGNGQAIADAALSKRVQAGFAAQGGLMGALMAQRGISGARNVLEGEAGFYQVYWQGSYDREALTSDLGKRFEGANISFKPYPSCRRTHAYIDAALALKREHGIEPEDVMEVIAFFGERVRFLCEPLEVRLNPRTVVDLQFNVPYTIATALVKGRATIDDFTVAAIKDSRVLGFAHKVRPQLDPELTRKEISPAVVEIVTKDAHYSKRVDFAYGHPQNPMSWEDLADKFRDCALHAAKPIPQEDVETAIAMVRRLETVDDVGQVIRIFGGSNQT